MPAFVIFKNKKTKTMIWFFQRSTTHFTIQVEDSNKVMNFLNKELLLTDAGKIYFVLLCSGFVIHHINNNDLVEKYITNQNIKTLINKLKFIKMNDLVFDEVDEIQEEEECFLFYLIRFMFKVLEDVKVVDVDEQSGKNL